MSSCEANMDILCSAARYIESLEQKHELLVHRGAKSSLIEPGWRRSDPHSTMPSSGRKKRRILDKQGPPVQQVTPPTSGEVKKHQLQLGEQMDASGLAIGISSSTKDCSSGQSDDEHMQDVPVRFKLDGEPRYISLVEASRRLQVKPCRIERMAKTGVWYVRFEPVIQLVVGHDGALLVDERLIQRLADNKTTLKSRNGYRAAKKRFSTVKKGQDNE